MSYGRGYNGGGGGGGGGGAADRFGEKADRVYVGNLPRDIRESELDDLFYTYGRIRSINVKSRAGAGAYAFIEFDHPDDAADAVRGRDGTNFANQRIRVEGIRGDGGRGDGGRGGRDQGGFNDRGGRPERPRGGMGAQHRGEWRLEVSGIPRTGSWQDLKDHMRSAGNVVYTQVDGNGGGVVEFGGEDDMRYALKNLDDIKFVSRTGDTGYIRVFPEGGPRPEASNRAQSPARDQDRSRGDDRRDDRDDRRGRSRSPRGRSRSPRRGERSASPQDRSPSRREDEAADKEAAPAEEAAAPVADADADAPAPDADADAPAAAE